jgi:hypothetical protein
VVTITARVAWSHSSTARSPTSNAGSGSASARVPAVHREDHCRAGVVIAARCVDPA